MIIADINNSLSSYFLKTVLRQSLSLNEVYPPKHASWSTHTSSITHLLLRTRPFEDHPHNYGNNNNSPSTPIKLEGVGVQDIFALGSEWNGKFLGWASLEKKSLRQIWSGYPQYVFSRPALPCWEREMYHDILFAGLPLQKLVTNIFLYRHSTKLAIEQKL